METTMEENWHRISAAGAAISDSVIARIADRSHSLGSACDSGRLCGGSGKHPAVAGQL
jgi:hypothetical protein